MSVPNAGKDETDVSDDRKGPEWDYPYWLVKPWWWDEHPEVAENFDWVTWNFYGGE